MTVHAQAQYQSHQVILWNASVQTFDVYAYIHVHVAVTMATKQS